MEEILINAGGGILAALAVGIVTLLLIRWRRRVPISATLARPVPEPWHLSLFGLLPQNLHLPHNPTIESVYQWLLLDQGAVDYRQTTLRLYLTNIAKETVVIHNIRVLRQRVRPVARGALITSPGGGSNESIQLAYNLDEEKPEAWETSFPERERLGVAPYFKLHSITLTPGETVDLTISAVVEKSAVDWRLAIECMVGTKKRSIRIPEDRKSLFRTTGHPKQGFLSYWHWVWYDGGRHGQRLARVSEHGQLLDSTPDDE
ncbi:UNVERIFIED_ORG: hypothetical protein FHR35_005506 [Microbispora rosea subsp. rosea]